MDIDTLYSFMMFGCCFGRLRRIKNSFYIVANDLSVCASIIFTAKYYPYPELAFSSSLLIILLLFFL
jgi:hypothetical protein